MFPLLPRLGLAKALVESAAPFSKRSDSATDDEHGCQIDLLIQTSESCCLVEIKRRKEIGDEAIGEMKAKVAALSLPAGISVRTALVHAGHLAPTVEAPGYFASVIDVR